MWHVHWERKPLRSHGLVTTHSWRDECRKLPFMDNANGVGVLYSQWKNARKESNLWVCTSWLHAEYCLLIGQFIVQLNVNWCIADNSGHNHTANFTVTQPIPRELDVQMCWQQNWGICCYWDWWPTCGHKDFHKSNLRTLHPHKQWFTTLKVYSPVNHFLEGRLQSQKKSVTSFNVHQSHIPGYTAWFLYTGARAILD